MWTVSEVKYFFLWAALLILGGCSLNNMPMAKATYAPISDAALYRQIAAIPGVTAVDLHWTNGFDNPNGYSGDVYARKASDGLSTLDRVLAILRQGHPGASLAGVQVAVQGEFTVSPPDVGLWSESDYQGRYGPQPGTGVPPDTPLRRFGDPVNTPKS